MSQYMYRNTKLPQYLPMPKFLTGIQLSNTERYIYTLLLSRAQYSQKNGMMDEQGRVYVFYPIHQIAEKSQKGTTTVKLALKHLIEVGILEKVSEGRGKANRLYLLFPDTEPGQKFAAGKLTPPSQKTDQNYGGKSTTSKYISKKINNSLRDYDYEEEEIF